MGITRSIRKLEQEFDLKAERFIILICVCISTTIIALPIAWLLGFL